MAATGLVKPDGTSRKPDYDQINELLHRLTQPLSAEESRRFDPAMSSGDGSLADPATFQLIVGWREQAWRNAEAVPVRAEVGRQQRGIGLLNPVVLGVATTWSGTHLPSWSRFQTDVVPYFVPSFWHSTLASAPAGKLPAEL